MSAPQPHPDCTTKPQACTLPKGPHGIAEVTQLLIAYAPFKQVDHRIATANSKIGRAPGSACETVRFLSKLVEKAPESAKAREKMMALADWVVSIQSLDKGRPWEGGVPSTPDLPPPANRHYYTIDAAFCGDAMLRVHRITSSRKYLDSAVSFARFIVNMSHGPDSKRPQQSAAFCEKVVADERAPLWDCRRFVKNLVALPVLKAATAATGEQDFANVAAAARTYLVPGLTSLWEYAETPAGCGGSGTCPATWRRVDGPHRERDHFVYGDTIAYGLRGLYEYEGFSKTVEAVYDRMVSFKGRTPRSRQYDGRIALAGYLRPQTAAPDDLSAYYDIVTLGILHEMKRAHRPEHFALADAVIRKAVSSSAAVPWKMAFDRSVHPGDQLDMTTLANIGEAMLQDGRSAPTGVP